MNEGRVTCQRWHICCQWSQYKNRNLLDSETHILLSTPSIVFRVFTPSSKTGEKYEGGLATEDLHPKFETSNAWILHEFKEAFSSSAWRHFIRCTCFPSYRGRLWMSEVTMPVIVPLEGRMMAMLRTAKRAFLTTVNDRASAFDWTSVSLTSILRILSFSHKNESWLIQEWDKINSSSLLCAFCHCFNDADMFAKSYIHCLFNEVLFFLCNR